MTKYSEEFKLEVVKYCIEEHNGFKLAAKHFNIPSKSTVQTWCRKYKEHGKNGLLKVDNICYSGEFKQNVIEYMHTNHLSNLETAIHFNLGNGNIVSRWERIYYEKGPQALYKMHCVKRKNMSSKSKKEKPNKEKEDLLEEIEQLRMENAYLKKLQALVQERTKPKQ